jgi:pimeloyl-ACP methyl ester carboxylesterase
MPLLDRSGTRISFADHASTREAGGAPVLLTHGFAASSAMFAGNLAALTAGNRVVTWDIRGHGESDYPADEASYSAATATGDMAAILDHLGIESAVLGGHSLGGYLSLDFALRSPDRVSGVILIDTGPGFRNPEARASWNAGADTSADAFSQRGLAALRGSSELHGELHRDATGLAMAARFLLKQYDSHVLDSLHTISAPTLVVVGANDRRFIPAAEHMARKMPDARQVIIDAAGHAPNVDQPAAFGMQVRAFLDELGPADGAAP